MPVVRHKHTSGSTDMVPTFRELDSSKDAHLETDKDNITVLKAVHDRSGLRVLWQYPRGRRRQ